MKKIRETLDSITSYRVVLYGLCVLTLSALILSALDLINYSDFGSLALSLTLLLSLCFASNLLLSKLYKVTVNHESSIITGLILFFVLAVPTSTSGWAGVAFAALAAIASKFIITWRSAHIFNPAAFGVLLASLVGIGSGAWWIANTALFVPMLIVGFLVLLKLRRFELFFAFSITSLVLIVIKLYPGSNLVDSAITALTLYPLLFLGTIMLTEPYTMPASRNKRLVFGVIVGLIFAANIDFGVIAASPHLALIIGNLFAFLVTSRAGTHLKLVEKNQLTPTTYNFAFEPDRPIKHAAGQFIDITLPDVKLDSRGNRRTFTIVSPPSENLINIGVKFYPGGSQFKNKLQSLKIGDEIIGSHVGGDFVLPKDTSTPLVFVAGGIGITPFISMISEICKSNIKYNLALYYFVSDNKEVAYPDALRLAKTAGIKVNVRTDRLTDEDIKKHPGAHFYLSGPPGLVEAYKTQLKKMGIKQIQTDYFSGY